MGIKLIIPDKINLYDIRALGGKTRIKLILNKFEGIEDSEAYYGDRILPG